MIDLLLDTKFRCPRCGGRHFSSIGSFKGLTNTVVCKDEKQIGCQWAGNREDAGLDQVRRGKPVIQISAVPAYPEQQREG